jgi:hypothetical protein
VIDPELAPKKPNPPKSIPRAKVGWLSVAQSVLLAFGRPVNWLMESVMKSAGYTFGE